MQRVFLNQGKNTRKKILVFFSVLSYLFEKTGTSSLPKTIAPMKKQLMPAKTSDKFAQLRMQVEELIKQCSDHDPPDACAILDLIHELEVHQAELENQNHREEELRTLRVQAEYQAREYNLAMEAIVEGVVFYDTNHMITRMNPAAEAMLGFTAQEVHTLPAKERVTLFQIQDMQGQPMPRNKMVGLRALQSEVVTNEEFMVHPRRAHSPITVLSSAAPIRNEHGDIIGAIQTLSDISERKRAVEALKRSEATFRRLAEANLIGVGIGDEEGCVSYINDEMLRMMGCTRDDFRKGRINWLAALAPESRDEHRRSQTELMHAGCSTGSEQSFLRPDGSRVPFLSAAAAVFDTNEHVRIALDLTKIKKTEQDLRQARSEAQTSAQEAQRKEQLLRRVLDVLPVGVFISDKRGRIAWTNHQVEKIWGGAKHIPLDRLEEYKGWRADSGKRIESHEWAFARAFSKGETTLEEVIDIECFDGSRKTILNSAAPVDDNGEGSANLAVAAIADITELKETEKALRESEEKFKAIFQMCPDPLVILDRETEMVLEANPAFANLIGRNHWEKITGRTVEELNLWLDENERSQIRELLAENGFVRDFEVHLRTKLYEVVFAIASLELLTLNARPCLLGVAKDISARKRAEEEAQRRAAQLEATIYAMIDGVIIYDARGNLLLINRAAQDLFDFPDGYFEQPILERSKIFRYEKEGRTLAIDEIPPFRALQGETIQDLVLTMHRPDGAVLSISCNASPIHQNEKQIGAVVAFRDMTEWIRQQDEIINARQDAEEAARTKSAFLSNMSHEIRTPLNGIKGMIELAGRKSNQPDVKKYLGLARQSSDHLMYIINDVLDLSKIDAGRMNLHLQSFSLRNILSATFPPLQSLAKDKGLKFDVRVDERIPDALRGDPYRLRQVLENVIGNAVKFTHLGNVNVSVKLNQDEATEDHVQVLFSISDTGIGIPPQKQDKIFQSFGQIDPAIHTQYGGSGLGLTICRHIVGMLGGEIWVNSTEGEGSTFSFTAVFGLAEEDVSAAAESRPPEMQTPLKILAAEDSKMNQIFTKELLTEKGHEVVIVEDGQAALDKLAREKFDLVLMDIRMPNMDGEQALRKIRKDPPAGVDPKTPVIALTAYALKDDKDRFLAQGFSGHLAKPIDIQEFDQLLFDIERQKFNKLFSAHLP